MVSGKKLVECLVVETSPHAWRPTGRFIKLPAQGNDVKAGDFVLVIIRDPVRIISFMTRLKAKRSNIWISEVLEAA